MRAEYSESGSGKLTVKQLKSMLSTLPDEAVFIITSEWVSLRLMDSPGAYWLEWMTCLLSLRRLSERSTLITLLYRHIPRDFLIPTPAAEELTMASTKQCSNPDYHSAHSWNGYYTYYHCDGVGAPSFTEDEVVKKVLM